MNIIKADVTIDNFVKTFMSSICERPNYINNMSYTQVCVQILGSLDDEYEYFTMLFDLVHCDEKVRFLSGKLERALDNNVFIFLQKLLKINEEEKGLSINRFVAFLDGEKLIPTGNDIYTKSFFIEKLKALFQYFKDNHGNLLHPDFKRILVDVIKWQNNYIIKWLSESKEVPKVIWYGTLTKSEEYFFHYMTLLGFDLLYFNPEGQALSLDVKEIKLPNQMQIMDFPKERPVKTTTVAYTASQEIDKMLFNENGMMFKAWQLRAYIPQAIVLKTTYDEIFILEREKAFIRPGFKVQNNKVFIPTLFAKVHGISSDTDEYWEKFNKLKRSPQSLLYTQFPITKEATGNPQFHYKKCLDSNGQFEPEKMIQLAVWQYKELPIDLQKSMAYVIARCIQDIFIKSVENDYNTKLYLFNQFINIPIEFIRLLQQFDYSQDIPKIIIFNSGKNGTLSRSDAVLLTFLNSFGLDIIIYNPTGQNDIEMYIKEGYLQAHWLDKISFDEEIKDVKNKSLLNKFFRLFE